MGTFLRIVVGLLVLALGVQPASPAEHASDVTLVGADADQRRVATEALDRFRRAGLDLPPLTIRYSRDRASCNGHAALFSPAGTDDRASDSIDVVTVCNPQPIALLHELGHAWEFHHADAAARDRFLLHWGLERWNDPDDAWADRGAEMAAETIAITLHRDSPVLRPGALRHICSYELLTSRPLPHPVAGTACG